MTLAGARIATPQESYGTNTSWAISDLCQAVHDQSQRITQLNMALAWAHKVIARGAEVAREKGDTADWSRVCDDCAATLPAIQPYVNGGQQ